MRSFGWRYFFDVLCVVAFLALVIFPWGDFLGRGMSLSSMLQPPSFVHPLGTDNLGRDLLVRCADAVRGAVLPLWFGVLVATLCGVALAILSITLESHRTWGYFSLWLQGFAAILASIPVGIAAFAWAVYSEKAGLGPVLFAVSVLFFVRAFLQSIDLYRHDKFLGYWEAHRAIGGSQLSRLLKYGLRYSWKWRLADGFGFHLRAAVAIEASLSYLGFGIQEPNASFGNMLASHFDAYLKGDFHSLVIIVLMLALTAAFPASLVAALKATAQFGTQAKARAKSSFSSLFGRLQNAKGSA